MNLSERERILIVKPSSLGDIVHALPAVEAIRRAAPAARIDWLVNSEWVPLLHGIPFLDRVVPFPRREFRGVSGWFDAKRWVETDLKPAKYELAVDFQGLLRSALISRLGGAGEIVGFGNAREAAPLFYHRRVYVRDSGRRHAVDRNLELAKALGADTATVTFTLPPGEPVSETGGLPQDFVLLHPFSRGPGKSLSVEEVRELVALLSPRRVVLVGFPEEPLDETWPENVLDCLGRTSLPQLIHLIRESAWTVSVDSGPMHLAAAIDERVLSLHTWSNPAVVGPWRPGSWIMRDSQLVKVADLEPDRFPERRDLKARFASRSRLFSESDIVAVAEFLNQRLSIPKTT
ncbi:MAG: glycosyltransferase family 9 protein [Verrucomicrobiales bacterium]